MAQEGAKGWSLNTAPELRGRGWFLAAISQQLFQGYPAAPLSELVLSTGS